MMSKLVRSNRHIWESLLICAGVGVLAVVWFDVKISNLSERLAPNAAEEQRRLQAQLMSDEQVDGFLREVLEDANSDRALVFLAHNGKTDLTGTIPFMYLSNSHVAMRKGLDWKEAWSRPVMLSNYTPLLRKMFPKSGGPRCVKRDRGDEDLTEVARARMVERGIELAYVCPLQGTNGVVGMITAEYLRRETPHPKDEAVLQRLQKAADQVHASMTAIKAH